MSRKTVSLLGWLLVPIGIVLALVSSIWLTGFLFSDAFTFWKSLDPPPAGAATIIDADGNDIWVETNNGKLFTATLRCDGDKLCKKWVEVKSPSEIRIEAFSSIKRGDNCEELDAEEFPRNPDGVTTDCVLAIYPGPEYDFKTYYAVTLDGSVKYWRNESTEYRRYLFCLGSSIVLSIIIVSVFLRLRRRVVGSEKAG